MNNEAVFFEKTMDALNELSIAKKVSDNLLTEKEKEELRTIYKNLDIFSERVAERLAKEFETEE